MIEGSRLCVFIYLGNSDEEERTERGKTVCGVRNERAIDDHGPKAVEGDINSSGIARVARGALGRGRKNERVGRWLGFVPDPDDWNKPEEEARCEGSYEGLTPRAGCLGGMLTT